MAQKVFRPYNKAGVGRARQRLGKANFGSTLRSKYARSSDRRKSSGPLMSRHMRTMLNYANLPKRATFKASGFYNSTISSSASSWWIYGNCMRKPVTWWNGLTYAATGYDTLGYDQMKTLYKRYCIYAVKFEFRFLNVTPYATDSTAATTAKEQLLVYLQLANSKDTEVSSTNVSMQFAAQPNCTVIPLQSNAVGPAKMVKVKRYITGRTISSGNWDENDLAWNGLFTDVYPTNSFGVYMHGTKFDHTALGTYQTIKFGVRYTMYGHAFGSVSLSDV